MATPTQIRGNTQIINGTILDAQIAAAAAIAFSKLASMATGNILAGNGGVATSVTMSGDATIGATGVLTIAAGAITDAKVNSGAAIATSKLADAANFILRGGSVAFTANQSMGSHNLTNLLDPVNPQDAATKNYVDAAALGLDVHTSVRLATAAVLPFGPAAYIGTPTFTLTAASNGILVVDGVTTLVGDRILVKNEATAKNNGYYVVSVVGTAGTKYVLTRSADGQVSADIVEGSFVFVEEGTTNTATGWIQTASSPTLDTTSLVWTQMAGAGVYTAGNGITLTGNAFSVNTANANGLHFNGTALEVLVADASLRLVAGGLAFAACTSAFIVVGNGSNIATPVAMSGDVTITNAGVTTISASAIVDSKVAAAAAIAWSKMAAVAAGSLIIGNGSNVATVTAMTGDVTITSGGVTTVNNSAGSGTAFPKRQNFITRETPTGLVNSSNTTYTLANTPYAGSEQIYLNGVLQTQGAGADYTISTSTITMISVPQTGDILRVSYIT